MNSQIYETLLPKQLFSAFNLEEQTSDGDTKHFPKGTLVTIVEEIKSRPIQVHGKTCRPVSLLIRTVTPPHYYGWEQGCDGLWPVDVEEE